MVRYCANCRPNFLSIINFLETRIRTSVVLIKMLVATKYFISTCCSDFFMSSWKTETVIKSFVFYFPKTLNSTENAGRNIWVFYLIIKGWSVAQFKFL